MAVPDLEPLIRVTLVVLEDLIPLAGGTANHASSSSSSVSMHMVESLWMQLPVDVVERILLFLPAIIQARFRCVCKRWRQVMNSVDFQVEASSTALRQGQRLHMLQAQFPGYPRNAVARPRMSQEARRLLKLRTCVDLPTSTLREDPFLHRNDPRRVFSYGGRFGVAWADSYEKKLRCRLLHLATQTWLELPSLDLDILVQRNWNIWLLPPASGSRSRFQVLVIASCDLHRQTLLLDYYASFFIYSDDDAGWRKLVPPAPWPVEGRHLNADRCAVSRQGYILYPDMDLEAMPTDGRLWRWEGDCVISEIPNPPFCGYKVVADPDTDAVFCYAQHPRLHGPTVKLYKLQEGRSSDCDGSSSHMHGRRLQWECVVESHTPQLEGHGDEVIWSGIRKVQIVGNKVYMVVGVAYTRIVQPSRVRYRDSILAYCILSGSYEWMWIRTGVLELFCSDHGWPHVSLVAA